MVENNRRTKKWIQYTASVIIALRREKIGGILLIIESLLLISWFIWPSLISYFQRNASIYGILCII